MRALLLVLLMLCPACQDTFESPPLPDLYKAGSGKDLAVNVPDGAAPADLATTAADLSSQSHDLGVNLGDLLKLPEHDLAFVDAR